MKSPSTFLTNTTTPAGRTEGQAINDPGGGTGSGVDQEIYNDPAYAAIAPIQSWKEGGISDSDETTVASDMRDSMEEMVSKKVSGVSLWVIGTNYTAPGTATDLVMWKGFQFINISNVGNLGNDPLLFPELWFKIPKVDTLMDQFYSGDSISGGLSPVADRAGAKYQQNMLFGNYRLGGNGDNFYDFFRVALDGTVVTGDTTLEDDIFKVGTGTEYFNIDIIAPDVVGTRTLLDMGGHVKESQTVGGSVNTMGEIHDDVMQRITGHFASSSLRFDGVLSDSGALDQTDEGGTGTGSGNISTATRVSFNSSNSVSPNPAKTDDDRTAHAALVTGASYIIVMVAA